MWISLAKLTEIESRLLRLEGENENLRQRLNAATTIHTLPFRSPPVQLKHVVMQLAAELGFEIRSVPATGPTVSLVKREVD